MPSKSHTGVRPHHTQSAARHEPANTTAPAFDKVKNTAVQHWDQQRVHTNHNAMAVHGATIDYSVLWAGVGV